MHSKCQRPIFQTSKAWTAPILCRTIAAEGSLEDTGCWAGEFCVVDNQDTVKCSFSGLSYHRDCLVTFGENKYHCGCHLIGVINERLADNLHIRPVLYEANDICS